MTAELDPVVRVIADALPTDPEDDTVIVGYRAEPCQDERCEGCRPVALPQWGSPEAVANGLVEALAAAGYRIVKDNPTVADLAAEQGVQPATEESLTAMGDWDPPLTDEERSGFAALTAMRSRDVRVELHREVLTESNPRGDGMNESSVHAPPAGYSPDAWQRAIAAGGASIDPFPAEWAERGWAEMIAEGVLRAALAELGGSVEFGALHSATGSVHGPVPRHRAEHLSGICHQARPGYQLVQRHVGPWTPVNEENPNG